MRTAGLICCFLMGVSCVGLGGESDGSRRALPECVRIRTFEVAASGLGLGEQAMLFGSQGRLYFLDPDKRNYRIGEIEAYSKSKVLISIREPIRSYKRFLRAMQDQPDGLVAFQEVVPAWVGAVACQGRAFLYSELPAANEEAMRIVQEVDGDKVQWTWVNRAAREPQEWECAPFAVTDKGILVLVDSLKPCSVGLYDREKGVVRRFVFKASAPVVEEGAPGKPDAASPSGASNKEPRGMPETDADRHLSPELKELLRQHDAQVRELELEKARQAALGDKGSKDDGKNEVAVDWPLRRIDLLVWLPSGDIVVVDNSQAVASVVRMTEAGKIAFSHIFKHSERECIGWIRDVPLFYERDAHQVQALIEDKYQAVITDEGWSEAIRLIVISDQEFIIFDEMEGKGHVCKFR